MGAGVCADIRGHVGGGGGVEIEIAADLLHLGDAQTIRAEIDTHGVRRREYLPKRKYVLHESEHCCLN